VIVCLVPVGAPQASFGVFMNMKPKYLAITGTLLISSGLIGIVPVILEQNSAAQAAPGVHAAATSTPTQVIQGHPAPNVASGHPARISIPSVGIDLPVVDGFYNQKTGDWTLTDTDAQFATITTEPNTAAGQTFIYGHATNRVFGPLLNAKLGTTATITTSNGYKFTYTLRSTERSAPTNTSILGYQGAPRLLLQTCQGLWWQNRQFFIFEFTKVQKP
jgi:LPXTG-site transpeptidase (sortase) family protein